MTPRNRVVEGMVGERVKEVVTLYGIKEEWLVDTGSQVSVISKSYLKRIDMNAKEDIIIHRLGNLDIRTANGGTLECEGYSLLEMEIKGKKIKKPVIIADDTQGKHIAILGTNILIEFPHFEYLINNIDTRGRKVYINEIQKSKTVAEIYIKKKKKKLGMSDIYANLTI